MPWDLTVKQSVRAVAEVADAADACALVRFAAVAALNPIDRAGAAMMYPTSSTVDERHHRGSSVEH